MKMEQSLNLRRFDTLLLFIVSNKNNKKKNQFIHDP